VETVENEPATGKVGWTKNSWRKSGNRANVLRLNAVTTSSISRVSTGIKEVDQVLSGSEGMGGIVPGSVVLLSGDPGIGKSTLLLQILSHVGGLYVSGEESAEQVKLRAERLKVPFDRILIFPETNI
jgi:DNA repair protein RadA/Sms